MALCWHFSIFDLTRMSLIAKLLNTYPMEEEGEKKKERMVLKERAQVAKEAMDDLENVGR